MRDILVLIVITLPLQPVEIKHERVRCPCLQCVYAATTGGDLKKHVEMKHEEVRYPCDQCAYSATTAILLKKHIEYKHKGVRYNCDQFVYVATSAWDPNSDPFDPQDFGFLESDPQKYADPRIRIQTVKYQPKTAKKKFTFNPNLN